MTDTTPTLADHLRALADLFDRHPDVPSPRLGVNVQANGHVDVHAESIAETDAWSVALNLPITVSEHTPDGEPLWRAHIVETPWGAEGLRVRVQWSEQPAAVSS